MNSKDKKRLNRIYELLDAVPFSASGTATQTGAGAVAFEEDMRAFRPAIQGVVKGMLLENVPAEAELVEGEDYENPDLLLDALEAWINQRKIEGWLRANSWGFRTFYEKFKSNHHGAAVKGVK